MTTFELRIAMGLGYKAKRSDRKPGDRKECKFTFFFPME